MSHGIVRFSERRTGYKEVCRQGGLGKVTPPIRVFRSLQYTNYALFWSSDLIASVGQFIREVALYWLAFEITGSAFALGILDFCEATPRLLLGVVGGVIVDRYDRLRYSQEFSFSVACRRLAWRCSIF